MRESVARARHAQLQRDGHRPHGHHLANIAGASQSIEPNYRNLFVKSNLSGDFTIVNDRTSWPT